MALPFLLRIAFRNPQFLKCITLTLCSWTSQPASPLFLPCIIDFTFHAAMQHPKLIKKGKLSRKFTT